MIEQDKDPTAKEVKNGMTQTPWEWLILDAVSGQDYENKYFDNRAAHTAVNNTYGKGYDPEQMHMIVLSLEWALSLIEKNGLDNADDLPYSLAQLSLKKARI